MKEPLDHPALPGRRGQDFCHSFAVLNTVIAAQGLDGRMGGGESEVLLVRREPPVDRNRAALVLDQDALLARTISFKRSTISRRAGCSSGSHMESSPGDAVLEPVKPRHVEFMGHEATIEKRDRAPADDGERAAEPVLQTA